MPVCFRVNSTTMGVTFRANIRWPENDLLFPQMLEMQKRLRSSAVRSGSSGTLATVDGLVDSDLTVRYADVAAQWRRLPSPDGKPSPRGPGPFQFTGGEVIRDLRIGLFLVSFIEPDLDDDLSLKIFAAYYGHKVLHVLDAGRFTGAIRWSVPQSSSVC